MPTLDATGFGPHRLGEQIALGGPAPPREADRTSDNCRLFSDPNFPSVWVMTDGAGVVRRVSATAPSAVLTRGDIGIGASEAQVRVAFPGLRREPHEYAIGGDNLYTAGPGESGLRFELDGDRRVTEMHTGAAPFLGYSEGCA